MAKQLKNNVYMIAEIDEFSVCEVRLQTTFQWDISTDGWKLGLGLQFPLYDNKQHIQLDNINRHPKPTEKEKETRRLSKLSHKVKIGGAFNVQFYQRANLYTGWAKNSKPLLIYQQIIGY